MTLCSKKFRIFECDCEKCKTMCHCPCVGTPDEVLELMEAGYGDRLCLDDWPSDVAGPDIHPALKGYEGARASYSVLSKDGCTFWKEGKCELHDKGLKPLLGRLAYHDNSLTDYDEGVDFVRQAWDSPHGKYVLEEWKKKHYKEFEGVYDDTN